MSTSTSLPTLADRPDAAIVIFDGHCRFCQAQVTRLARWDTRGHVAFVSLHDPEVARRWPELSHEDLMAQMYVVTPEGEPFAGAAAFRYLSRHLPRLWPLRVVMHIPGSMPLWQSIYSWVGRRRYWFGKASSCDDGTCRVHGRG